MIDVCIESNDHFNRARKHAGKDCREKKTASNGMRAHEAKLSTGPCLRCFLLSLCVFVIFSESKVQ